MRCTDIDGIRIIGDVSHGSARRAVSARHLLLRGYARIAGEAKRELFDYIEMFYNERRRHSTIGQMSPAAYERRARSEGMDAMGQPPSTRFLTAPTPLSVLWRRRTKTTQFGGRI